LPNPDPKVGTPNLMGQDLRVMVLEVVLMMEEAEAEEEDTVAEAEADMDMDMEEEDAVVAEAANTRRARSTKVEAVMSRTGIYSPQE
jgi:hypothetical protein